jgi:hypothetical protein
VSREGAIDIAAHNFVAPTVLIKPNEILGECQSLTPATQGRGGKLISLPV